MTSTFVIRGKSGRLRSGSRTVATLGPWSASPLEDGSYQLSVERAERDPFWWDNRDPDRLVAELCLGKTDHRFTARITSDEPMAIQLWRADAED